MEVKDYNSYKYIYPPNTRHQEQLDIMMRDEYQDRDSFAPEYLENKTLFVTEYWDVSENKFPYEGADKQFIIIARQPVYDMADLTPEMWQEFQVIIDRLTKEYDLKGGAFCMRYGDPSRSGASMKRLHAHVIMPAANTKVKFSIGGKSELKEGLVIKAPEELGIE